MRRIAGLVTSCLCWVTLAWGQENRVLPGPYYHTHATNCRTGGLPATVDQLCIEESTGALYRCAHPDAAGASNTICDNNADWQLIGPGASTNATQIQGDNVSTTNPTDQQVLRWNSATSQYEPTTMGAGTGDVTLAGNQTFTTGQKTFTNAPIINVPDTTTFVINTDGQAFTTVNETTRAVEFGANNVPYFPTSWTPTSVEVDGTNCLTAIAETVNGSDPLRNFPCQNSGKFSGQFILPLSYRANTALNFRIKGRSIGTTSQVLALDISAWCRGNGDTIDSTYSTGVACDMTSGTTANLIRQCNVNFTPDGSCQGGDVVSWRAVVNNGRNTATIATAAIKILGGMINYPKLQDRE